ncbi:uncharacterized protein LAESUDRAFT_687030 [Laetiporus sulphureus 93-53]|uniref:Uncharacterized protein n=1 Tax=Laetiporus sulphureus 93-53 TaxID=1314785 RepID=A0A165BKZ1_9APHY|nr:uncharacterized protein LAESUDRAFT_687030 [Laetiporus sulphureus 93-53]KZT01244.1 hypothetical protein LAESUDRAFT_687030 [Laetiporus sulphureus 93-53]
MNAHRPRPDSVGRRPGPMEPGRAFPRLRSNSLGQSSRPADSNAASAPLRSRLDSFLSHKKSGSKPTAPSSYVPVDAPTEPVYPHSTIFRDSSQMELHVRSPSVKMTRPPGYEVARSLPTYDHHNKVHGTIMFDPSLYTASGRLTITLEGAFVFIAPPAITSLLAPMANTSSMHRHVFLHSTHTIPMDGTIEARRSTSSLRESLRESLRDTITTSVRSRRRERRPGQSNASKGALRPFPFTFDVPTPTRRGEELPPTFRSVAEGLGGIRGRAFVERSEVTYKLIATWDSNTGSDQISVEAPIVFEPDADFESLDGRELQPESWAEVQLRSDRPLPFTCVAALPDMPSFPRSASIPYYVVFTTKPRSATLAREIVLDATITVALVRQVNIDVAPGSPSSSSASPVSPSSSNTSIEEASAFILTHKTNIMKRMVNSAPPILSRRQPKPPPPLNVNKPLPEIAPEGYSNTRTILMDIYAGFPKRPRLRMDPGQQHPSLTAHTQLPDGLYKSKLQLNKEMMPSIEWGDLSVKYFLDVSVLFGSDELRARIPIRVL